MGEYKYVSLVFLYDENGELCESKKYWADENFNLELHWSEIVKDLNKQFKKINSDINDLYKKYM